MGSACGVARICEVDTFPLHKSDELVISNINDIDLKNRKSGVNPKALDYGPDKCGFC